MKLRLHWRQLGRPLRQLRPWRPTRRQLLISVGCIAVLTVTAIMLYPRTPLPAKVGLAITLVLLLVIVIERHYKWPWTGFHDYTRPKIENQEFQRGKTLWDWMQLLLIPIVLASGGLLFNYVQSTNEQRQVQQRAQADRESAEKRAQTDREIAQEGFREAALQTYFDRMSELLLDKKLRESQNNAEVRNVARTRTLSVLSTLDGERKGTLLRFLQESGLINGPEPIRPYHDL